MSEVMIAEDGARTVPVGQEYWVAGVQNQVMPVIGEGTTDVTIPLIGVPSSATSVIGSLRGFDLQFLKGDHNLQQFSVYLSRIDGDLPSSVDSMVTFKDKSTRPFAGSLYYQFLYLAPNTLGKRPEGAIEPAVTVNPGMFVADAFVLATDFSGVGEQSWSITGIKDRAPQLATQVVASLIGFQLSYPNENHRVQQAMITIDEPSSALPEAITGKALLKDTSDGRQFQGTASVMLIYFAPYWI